MALARQTRSGCTPKRSVAPPGGDREAGLDLVEDEDDAVLGTQLAHPLQVPGLRHDDADVHHGGLHDEAGDLVAPLLKHALEVIGVVERHHLDVLGRVLDHPLRHRRSPRPVAAAHEVGVGNDREHHAVMMPVIRALDLADHVPPRRCPRHADRVHRGFGARVGEPQHLEIEPPADFLAEGDRRLGGDREVGAAARRLVDGLDDPRVRVAHHHGAEPAVEIEVLAAVLVPDVAALPVGHVDRVRLHLLERRHDAEGQGPGRPLVQLRRTSACGPAAGSSPPGRSPAPGRAADRSSPARRRRGW